MSKNPCKRCRGIGWYKDPNSWQCASPCRRCRHTYVGLLLFLIKEGAKAKRKLKRVWDRIKNREGRLWDKDFVANERAYSHGCSCYVTLLKIAPQMATKPMRKSLQLSKAESEIPLQGWSFR